MVRASRGLRLTAIGILLLAAVALPFAESQAKDLVDFPLRHLTKPPEKPTPRDKWAVLIGVTKPQDQSVGEERNASRNVTALANCLRDQDFGRFAKDHVVALTDTAATSAQIHAAVLDEFLCKRALPGDMIVVYFSGKVMPSSDDADVVFCSFDTNPAQAFASGVPLKRLLADLKARTQSKEIVCLLDTSPCEHPSLPTNANDLPKVKHIAQDCHVTVLSASELFSHSYNSATVPNSAFCHYLIDGIEAGGGQLALSTVADSVVQNIKSDSLKANKQQASIFVTAQDNPAIAELAFGCSTKSSTIKPMGIGHPLSAEDKVASQRGGGKAEDEEDDGMSTVDMHDYMAKMKHDIQARWKSPKGALDHRIVVVFTIKRDGTIFDAQLVQGCGDAAVDATALEALSAPIDPLPQGSPKSVQIQYKFDWKVTRQ